MTLLKDLRLLLIVGLAILCLLALRLCSAEYQPDTIGSAGQTSEDTEVAAESQGVIAKDSEATAATDTAEETSESEDASADSATSATEESATDSEKASADEQTTEASSNTEDAEESGEGESGQSDTVEATGEADTSDDSTAGVEEETDTQASDDTAEGEAESSADQSQSGDEDAATVDSENQPMQETADAVFEVVPSSIGEAAEIIHTQIVIQPQATSGDLIPDLKADIGTVKEGLQQYSDKLDVIDTLFEKLKVAE